VPAVLAGASMAEVLAVVQMVMTVVADAQWHVKGAVGMTQRRGAGLPRALAEVVRKARWYTRRGRRGGWADRPWRPDEQLCAGDGGGGSVDAQAEGCGAVEAELLQLAGPPLPHQALAPPRLVLLVVARQMSCCGGGCGAAWRAADRGGVDFGSPVCRRHLRVHATEAAAAHPFQCGGVHVKGRCSASVNVAQLGHRRRHSPRRWRSRGAREVVRSVRQSDGGGVMAP